MSRLILLTGFLAGFVYLSSAQGVINANPDIKTFDTVFQQNAFNTFFDQYPAVKEITILVSSSDITQVDLIRTDSTERFDWTFEGDRYIFEKRYSPLASVKTYPDVLAHHGCEERRKLLLRIMRDNISARLSYACPKEGEIIVDEKVEARARYRGGILALKKEFYKRTCGLGRENSASVLRMLVLADGSIGRIELTDGEDGGAVPIVKELLQSLGNWQAALQGGRAVNSYVRFFIQTKINGDAGLYFQGLHW